MDNFREFLKLKIRYLTVEEVDWFHDRILEFTGGEHGVIAKGNLEFVLDRVKDVGEGLDQKASIVKKAGFLLHSLVTQHPFVNGNKRTAFEVVDAFLRLNGFVLQTKTDQALTFLADTGSGLASVTRAEEWIATNLAEKKKGSR